MDEELTGGFSDPCGTCSEVAWGLTDDGVFYCRNCHNVIERTQDVDDLGDPGSSRISSVRKGPRGKKAEGGLQWTVCEGFQLVLKSQAEALIRVGVDSRFKDQVLWRMWRLFLQRTHQAYTHTPARSASFRLMHDTADTDTGPSCASGLDSESCLDSEPGMDSDSGLRSSAGSVTAELSDWSLGSVDSDAFVSRTMKRRRTKTQMTMKRTLSLLHLALVWARSEVPLSLLLRLVHQGVVPYINSYESFPEEMKLNNIDGLIFRERSVPSYSAVHADALVLMRLLPLPAFPPISIESPLHPLNLSLRYMIQLNLPDEMAEWVELVLDQTDLMSPSGLDPSSGLPQHELLAAAAVMVTMKLLFGLDDQTEWELSSGAPSSGSVFSLRRWYRLLQRSLRRGERRSRRSRARKQWIPSKPFYFSHKQKIVVQKKRRVSDCLTSCFRALSSGRHGDAAAYPGGGVYSCPFLWGRGPGADGPSMHHMTLRGGARTVLTNQLSEENYWLLPFTNHRCSGPVPHMFLWLLRLFSFLLDVKSKLLLNVVQRLERVLLQRLKPKKL